MKSGLGAFFLKLEARDALSEREKAVFTEALGAEVAFAADQVIIRENVPQTVSRLLVEGLVARAKTLPSGGRQITELHIPGDFVDLHSFLLKQLDHDIVALTPVRLFNVPHDALKRITETEPHLTRLLWLNTLLDAAIHREWLVSAGRRSAPQQVANLFCELVERYRVVELSDGRTCPLPITQAELGDVVGLSTVHVNRVVQELRRDYKVEWRSGELVIPDFEALAAFAEFDRAYLLLERQPR